VTSLRFGHDLSTHLVGILQVAPTHRRARATGLRLAHVRCVSETAFVDHYETLQLSAGADGDTIERVYRLLAKRFHPDNQLSGDPDQFNEVHRAYETLSDPERRAKYDVTYDEEKGHQWRIFDQGSAADGPEQDRRIFHGVLSLLYVARRREPEHGGLGAVHLERMLGVPREHLEFPLWYLRQRGWTETLSGGKLAITVEGIDVLGNNELSLPRDRLLTASSATTVDEGPGRLSGDTHSNHGVSHTEGPPAAWSSSRPA